MGQFPRSWWLLHEAKSIKSPPSENPVDLEGKLHKQITDYCGKQWPRWKYIRARMDERSTIGIGVHDITVFAPSKVICIECKARDEKPGDDQLIWIKELEMIGWPVYVVRSFEEFLSVLKDNNLWANENQLRQ
jgi:hypothetical protein